MREFLRYTLPAEGRNSPSFVGRTSGDQPRSVRLTTAIRPIRTMFHSAETYTNIIIRPKQAKQHEGSARVLMRASVERHAQLSGAQVPFYPSIPCRIHQTLFPNPPENSSKQPPSN